MLATHEVWQYSGNERVWVGKYKNSNNLPHWHYEYELLSVERGGLEVFCEKSTYTLSEGQALLIGSGEVHYMHALSSDTLTNVFIFSGSIVDNFIKDMRPSVPKLSSNYNLGYKYERLKKVLSEKPLFYDIEAEGIITQIIIDIYRNEKLVKSNEDSSSEVLFKKLLSEITGKYEYYTFEDGAAFMGMSASYFSRYFHQMAGMTFSQFLNYVRVENAIKLRRENGKMPMTEIAIRCGFTTIRNFNRTFKDITGYTPKRLPSDYTLEDKFSYSGSNSGNPTMEDCQLVE